MIVPITTATAVLSLLPIASSFARMGITLSQIGDASPRSATSESSVTDKLLSFAPDIIRFIREPEPFVSSRKLSNLLLNRPIQTLTKRTVEGACLATIAQFRRRYSNNPSLLNDADPAFEKILASLKSSDFYPEQFGAAHLRTAMEIARRSILPSENSAEPPSDVLNQYLVDAIIEITQRQIDRSKTPTLAIPKVYREFLHGPSGIAEELSAYIAAYLIADEQASQAVLQAILQGVADDQGEMLRLLRATCARELASHEDSENLLSAFRTEIEGQSKRFQEYLDNALNESVRPPLIYPFDESGGTAASVIRRFSYSSRYIPMVGRASAETALLDFIDAPGSVLWTIISGDAGSGKNRLASEFISKVSASKQSGGEDGSGEWTAGFLVDVRWLEEKGYIWVPRRDSLLVIDRTDPSTGNVSAALNRFLAVQVKRVEQLTNDENLLPRIRVIVLDRLSHDHSEGIVQEMCRTQYDTDAFAAIADRILWRGSENLGIKCLNLRPLGDTDALDVVHAFVRKAADRPLRSEETERVFHAISKDPQLKRPLFAMLLGDGLAREELPPGILSPVSVAQSALKSQFGQLDTKTPSHSMAKNLLAFGTAAGGVRLEELFDEGEAVAIISSDGAISISSQVYLDIEQILHKIGAEVAGDAVTPLAPDYLGELFVLQHLLQLRGSPGRMYWANFIAVAWKLGVAGPERFLMQIAEDFLDRLDQVEEAVFSIPSKGSPETRHKVEQLFEVLLRSSSAENVIAQNDGLTLKFLLDIAVHHGHLRLTEILLRDLLESGAPASMKGRGILTFGFDKGVGPNSDVAIQLLDQLDPEHTDPDVRWQFSVAILQRQRGYLAKRGDVGNAIRLSKFLRKFSETFDQASLWSNYSGTVLNLFSFHLEHRSIFDSHRLGHAAQYIEQLKDVHIEVCERFGLKESAEVRLHYSRALAEAGLRTAEDCMFLHRNESVRLELSALVDALTELLSFDLEENIGVRLAFAYHNEALVVASVEVPSEVNLGRSLALAQKFEELLMAFPSNQEIRNIYDHLKAVRPQVPPSNHFELVDLSSHLLTPDKM